MEEAKLKFTISLRGDTNATNTETTIESEFSPGFIITTCMSQWKSANGFFYSNPMHLEHR